MTAARRRAGTVGVVAGLAVLGACTAAPGAEDPGATKAGRTTTTASDPVEVPTRKDFPDESTTGVPDGVDLERSGSITVEEDGAVIEGQEVTGTITVKADDVVIRNTRVLNTGHFPVQVDGGDNLLVEDTEIDGQGRGDAAVAFSRYTLRRVHIHNIPEGPRIAGRDVTIEDSLIHRLVQKGDNHTDVVQVVSGRRITLRGNALEVSNPEEGILGNAAFMFGEDNGPVSTCLVERNYLDGGNYTVNGGGGGTTGAACTFRDNVLGSSHRYGATANLGPATDWDSSNVWLETGQPVSSGAPDPSSTTRSS